MKLFGLKIFLILILTSVPIVFVMKWSVDICLPVEDEHRIFAPQSETPTSICVPLFEWNQKINNTSNVVFNNSETLPIRPNIFVETLNYLGFNKLTQNPIALFAHIPKDKNAMTQLALFVFVICLLLSLILSIIRSQLNWWYRSNKIRHVRQAEHCAVNKVLPAFTEVKVPRKPD